MGLVNKILALFAAGALGLASTDLIKGREIQQETGTNKRVILVDETAQKGLRRNNQTFGIAAVDLDNDEDDDLVISNHGNNFPAVYLNNDGVFKDSSSVLSSEISRIMDRHGPLVLDLDNDGDSDIIFAGGGANGVGLGSPNEVYRNLLIESGKLSFENVSDNVNVGTNKFRSRSFFPVSSSNGSKVDLYLVGKFRAGFHNSYFVNKSLDDIIFLEKDKNLAIPSDSEGVGFFADYNRDGKPDLFLIDHYKVKIFKNRNGKFKLIKTTFSDVAPVESIALGDLNNDGYPEVYLGMRKPHSFSDNVSFNSKEIHFVINNQKNDLADRIDFKTNASEIGIDFLPAKGLNKDNPSDVYIGRNKINPKSRVTTIKSIDANGMPEFNEPGIYLWKDEGINQWHMYVKWKQEQNISEERGLISSENLYDIRPSLLESFVTKGARDKIYINNQGKEFKYLKKFKSRWFSHSNSTRSVTMSYDFDNNGFADIIGIRGSQPGEYNGNLFVLLNQGDFKFRLKTIKSKNDDIYQADKLVVGFFNPDLLPDVFITNGWGLMPENNGPYQLFINHTSNTNNSTIIQLEGVYSNRDALNTQIELYDRSGNLLGYRERFIRGRAQDSPKLQFGLGDYKGRITAKIMWPSGKEQKAKIRPNSINYIKEK